MSWPHFLGIYRLLNDPGGLGLEVGTSLFFFVTNALCHSSFAYFADLEGRPTPEASVIRELIDGGYVDTIHAYGDFDAGGFERRHAELVVAECERYGLRLPFWTNHGSDKNAQNLGHTRLSVYQEGDDPGSISYHLDLLRQAGAEFFWVDDGYQESVAEGTPLLYGETARDGSALRLVRRYRGLHGRPAPMAGSLADQMTAADLDLLVEREEACIYYQHLGAWERTDARTFIANTPPYFDDRGLEVLEHLAGLFRSGRCLVTTPARLLRFLHIRDSVSASMDGHDLVISAETTELTGLSVECGRPPRRVVTESAAGIRTAIQTTTATQAKGAVVVSVPWQRLPEFAW